MIGIYKITNIINHKSYIGQSINIEKRWYEHKCKAFCKKDVSYNSALHHGFRKYGVENFSFEILEECHSELLDLKEREYIKKENTLSPNGYNILIGGQNNRSEPLFCMNCGKQIGRGTKTKLCHPCYYITQRKSERPNALELARTISEYGFKGAGRIFKVSGNAIKKWCVDYNIPKYKKEIISWHSDQMGIVEKKKENPSLSKKVAQKDKNTGEIINVFESASSAGRSLGKKNSHIIEVCNGIGKTAYGYRWEYI